MTAPKLGTASPACPLFLLLSASLQGCLLPLEPHWRLNVLGFAICDGGGGERPFLWGKDRFALLLDLLAHPEEGVRDATARGLGTNTGWAGTHYTKLADAYIDAGRGAHLMEALGDAWAKAPIGSYERYNMAEAFVECRCVQYIWEHPDMAAQVKLEPHTAPYRGWLGSLWKRDLQLLGPRLVEGGDERFRRVWEDYQSLLKAAVWWDSG